MTPQGVGCSRPIPVPTAAVENSAGKGATSWIFQVSWLTLSNPGVPFGQEGRRCVGRLVIITLHFRGGCGGHCPGSLAWPRGRNEPLTVPGVAGAGAVNVVNVLYMHSSQIQTLHPPVRRLRLRNLRNVATVTQPGNSQNLHLLPLTPETLPVTT